MEKHKRPKVLHGETTKILTGCGNLYITINKDGDKPVEVFATLGMAGGCERCQNEALTRCITMGLKYGVPIDEFQKQLTGIACPKPAFGGGKNGKTLSCADAIAKVLKDYTKE